MFDNKLLEELERYLRWKKSSRFYAKKLGITEEDVSKMLNLLHERKIQRRREKNEKKNLKFTEDVGKGTAEVILDSPTEIRNLEQLIEKCNIDTTKWEIVRYVQNFWGNKHDPHWQVKAWLKVKSSELVFKESFEDFLSCYTPCAERVEVPELELDKEFGCLLLDKQDPHFNRFDINGDNDIEKRFQRVDAKISLILYQASLSHNIEKIIYVLGSDSFNAEFTGSTTRGTPQENIHSYHDAFRMVCDHEVSEVKKLLKAAGEVEIIFVPGNHDQFVGWHMVNWLKAYFRDEPRLTIDDNPEYRKYVSYGTSAIMLAHGDRVKNAKLAGVFPIEYREHWSKHKYFYVFTGDKHIESSENINSIKFYRIAAFTTSRSDWEDHGGMIDVVGEATGFLFDDQHGLTNIFKHYL